MQQDMVTIPDWIDARKAVETGKASALDEFIYHNEPAGDKEETEFRTQLEALIDYLAEIFVGDW
jgi:hypothetical protein